MGTGSRQGFCVRSCRIARHYLTCESGEVSVRKDLLLSMRRDAEEQLAYIIYSFQTFWVVGSRIAGALRFSDFARAQQARRVC